MNVSNASNNTLNPGTAAYCRREYLGAAFGALWPAIVIIMWLCALSLMIACVWEIRSHLSKSANRNSTDIKVVVLALQAIFCFFRLIWYLDPSPNTTIIGLHIWQDMQETGILINQLLIKIPQLLFLGGCTLIILVWGDLVRGAQKLKKTDQSSQTMNVVTGMIAVLAFLALPLNLLSVFGVGGKSLSKMFANASNGVFALYMIVMLACGVRYVISLSDVLKNLKGGAGSVIEKIQTVVTGQVITALVVIGVIILNFSTNPCDPSVVMQLRSLIFLVGVHAGELSASSLAYYSLRSVQRKESGSFKVSGRSSRGTASNAETKTSSVSP